MIMDFREIFGHLESIVWHSHKNFFDSLIANHRQLSVLKSRKAIVEKNFKDHFLISSEESIRKRVRNSKHAQKDKYGFINSIQSTERIHDGNSYGKPSTHI